MMRRPPRSTLFPYMSSSDLRCRDWLARAAALAVDYGIHVMLEPIHPLMRNLSFVHTMEHGKVAHQRMDGFERSEEHTYELQSQFHIVCRLLLEKKKQYLRTI